MTFAIKNERRTMWNESERDRGKRCWLAHNKNAKIRRGARNKEGIGFRLQ